MEVQVLSINKLTKHVSAIHGRLHVYDDYFSTHVFVYFWGEEIGKCENAIRGGWAASWFLTISDFAYCIFSIARSLVSDVRWLRIVAAVDGVSANLVSVIFFSLVRSSFAIAMEGSLVLEALELWYVRSEGAGWVALAKFVSFVSLAHTPLRDPPQRECLFSSHRLNFQVLFVFSELPSSCYISLTLFYLW